MNVVKRAAPMTKVADIVTKTVNGVSIPSMSDGKAPKIVTTGDQTTTAPAGTVQQKAPETPGASAKATPAGTIPAKNASATNASASKAAAGKIETIT